MWLGQVFKVLLVLRLVITLGDYMPAALIPWKVLNTAFWRRCHSKLNISIVIQPKSAQMSPKFQKLDAFWSSSQISMPSARVTWKNEEIFILSTKKSQSYVGVRSLFEAFQLESLFWIPKWERRRRKKSEKLLHNFQLWWNENFPVIPLRGN